MADPAIDGLVSRRSFTAERSRKSACVSRQTGRSPPPPEKNEDTGVEKRMDLRVYSTPTLLTNACEWISSGGGRDTRESEVLVTTAPN